MFGKKRNRKDELRASVPNYSYLRAQAEAAGFNPLTALMAGGGGLRGPQPTGVPALASNQMIARLGGAFADLADSLQPEDEMEKAAADEDRKLRNDLTRMRIETLRKGLEGPTPVPAVARAGGGVVRRGVPDLARTPGRRRITGAELHDEGFMFTVPSPLGGREISLPFDPEEAERMFGDIGNWLAGAGNLGVYPWALREARRDERRLKEAFEVEDARMRKAAREKRKPPKRRPYKDYVKKREKMRDAARMFTGF